MKKAEDVTRNLYEEQNDLVADFPIINNRDEAVAANYYDDELSDIHNALQLQAILLNKIYII